jgi:hypothetical protein
MKVMVTFWRCISGMGGLILLWKASCLMGIQIFESIPCFTTSSLCNLEQSLRTFFYWNIRR